MRWGLRSPLRLSVLVGGTFLFLVYLLLFKRNREVRVEPISPSKSTTTNPKESCAGFALGENVVVSIKTGASEAAEKVPMLLQSSIRCAENLLFFSDLEQDIQGYHLYDALDTVLPSVISNNTDFDYYRDQKELWSTSKDLSPLKGVKHPEFIMELAAWTLDKYKFLHTLEKTWDLKPNKDWYLLIDADTYLFWPNLLTWLGTMDPNKKSYFGSEVVVVGDRFAHGGSGIVISKAAMIALVVDHQNTAELWDAKTRDYCCGDQVLGVALRDLGVDLQDVWPFLSGETLSTIPFGPGTLDYMCNPALSMHHLTDADSKKLAAYEDQRVAKDMTPLLHIEIFHDLLKGSFIEPRENWDNLASDGGEFGKTGGVEVEAATFEECTKACEANKDCFQYEHHDHICYLGMSVRLGKEKKADDKGMWKSGWHRERLQGWIDELEKCEGFQWPKQGA